MEKGTLVKETPVSPADIYIYISRGNKKKIKAKLTRDKIVLRP
jgi:hypothetical protein